LDEYSVVNVTTENKDHFITKNGIRYAGTHLILDLWGAKNLDNLELVEQTLRQAVDIAEATLLHINLHHFEPNGGISGVAVLAESHISIHTWPEHGYAALDLFMCGKAKPHKCIDVFKKSFHPERIMVSEQMRGGTA
jgi:S-adenosylmethionine decarboxylase